METVDINKKIWLSSPHMGAMEQVYVKEAFDTNWVAPLGPNINAFEKAIANSLKDDVNVAALSSGTAALHLGLKLLNVEKGDVVICQSFTFSASANPIMYLGAIPIFVDSEKDTWNLSPDLLENAIRESIKQGKKPKAIIAVHLYGMPYKIKEIRDIADKYEIAILEDSAEALGSSFMEHSCGTFGDIAVLSFNGNKIITTSGGGAMVSKNPDYISRAIYLATQARDDAPHYQHSEVGFNYRMSNILAGIGRGQMLVLEDRVKARRANYETYKKELEKVCGIEFLPEPPGYYSNRWLSCILTPSYLIREKLRLALLDENIESRPLWKPLHLQPIFEGFAKFTDGTSEDLFDRGLCLPSGSNLTQHDLNCVIKKIKEIL